jgi:hypothetical protein
MMRCQKPVQLLWVDLNAIKFEHHRRSSHGAAFSAESSVGFDSTQWIVPPFFFALSKRWHRQLKTMEKITPAPRRKFSFPPPINLQSQPTDEQKQNNTVNDERPTTLQNSKV